MRSAVERHNWTLRNLGQLIEDAAMLCVLASKAGLAQALELSLQLAQLANALHHMPDVLIEKFVDFAAILGWRVLESQ